MKSIYPLGLLLILQGLACTPAPWTLSAHPCTGNQTDTLWCDNDDVCLVGCGTTTNGDAGAYVTIDGGQTWAKLFSEGNVLDNMRVNDISRSSDGLLYLAGEVAGTESRVVSVDADGAALEVWNRQANVDFSFSAGSFRRNSEGFSIAESVNGNGVVYRASDDEDPSASWSTADGFWSDGDEDDDTFGVQILQLVEHAGVFYGAGSTISQPPTVVISDTTQDPLDFAIVQFATEGLTQFDGELFSIAVDEGGIVAGGVNQTTNAGVIFHHFNEGSSDVTDATTWSRFDVSILSDLTTHIEGVCVSGGSVYAVGREGSASGIVLRSTDGGITFSDVTSRDKSTGSSRLEPLQRCYVTSTGGAIVAGAEGQVAVYTP